MRTEIEKALLKTSLRILGNSRGWKWHDVMDMLFGIAYVSNALERAFPLPTIAQDMEQIRTTARGLLQEEWRG